MEQGAVALLGRHWILDRIVDAATGTYIAVGDGTAEPSQADTALASERFRIAASVYRDMDQIVAECNVSSLEANFHWREVGLFVESAEDAGSGILLARALVDEPKDELRTVTICFELPLTAV